jgi:hypothetical protein
MHKTSIHVSLEEIGGETHSICGTTPITKAPKTSTKKTTKFTTPNLLYKPGKSQKVPHAALASIPLNNLS